MPSASRWRLRLFGALFDAACVTERAAAGLFYLAAGSLRRADLRENVQREWATFNAHDREVLEGLRWWERDVYERFLQPGDRVLIVGAGSGRDLIALLEGGHDVVGLDPSAQALAIARQHLLARGRSADLIEGSVEDTELPGTFDVIVFSENCYNFILGTSHRVGALRSARRHLNEHGRIIVTYFQIPAPQRRRAVALARLSSWLTGSDWHAEPHDVLRRIGSDGRVFHYHHLFTPAEFEREAQEAGLRVVSHRHPPDPTVAVLVV